MITDVWKPYLIFDHLITTHKFNPTNYRYIDVSHRKKLHNEVMNLHNKGWGYTKIHHHLIKNGFEIGKSRTTVDIMIKKIKKREQFLNQTIYKSGFQDFRVELLVM
jgi:hypothetical protein